VDYQEPSPSPLRGTSAYQLQKLQITAPNDITSQCTGIDSVHSGSG